MCRRAMKQWNETMMPLWPTTHTSNHAAHGVELNKSGLQFNHVVSFTGTHFNFLGRHLCRLLKFAPNIQQPTRLSLHSPGRWRLSEPQLAILFGLERQCWETRPQKETSKNEETSWDIPYSRSRTAELKQLISVFIRAEFCSNKKCFLFLFLF